MANQRCFGFSRVLATGAPVPNATISVFNQGTLTLSSIFSDTIGTVKANPFTADANGYWFFYAVNGRYDVQWSGGPGNYTIGDVELASFVSLNGLTGDTQTFAVGTTGADFGISSAGTTHTFNLPDASASNRGAVTTAAQTFAGAKTFSTPIALGSGGTGITTAPTSGQTLLGTAGGLWVVASIAGTTNQITVTPGSGTLTLSTPQNLHTAATPTFASLTLSGLTANSFAYSGTAGLLTTTTAPTNGQLLVGQTGAAPTLGTIVGTGGTTATFSGTTWTINSPSSTGITSINGLSGATQTFATGTAGTDFGISSIGSTHTFNIPDAAATARGFVNTSAQTFAGVKTFPSAPVFSVGIGAQTTFTGGTGTLAVRMEGQAFVDSTIYSSTTPGPNATSSVSILANTLAVDGKSLLRITMGGNIVGNANAKKATLIFGATSVDVLPSNNYSVANRWRVVAYILRVTSTTQRLWFDFMQGTTNTGTGTTSTPAETLTGAVTLSASLTAPTTNADITQDIFHVELLG
jgi:hypothetical protein